MDNIFFYGLFMDPEIVTNLGCSPIHTRPAKLDGYGLRIGEKASLFESNTEYCWGQLMSLSKKDIDHLYAPDGLNCYYPINVSAKEVGGNITAAKTYVLPESMLKNCNSDYARKLYETAQRFQFPNDYLEIIRRFF